MMLRAVLRVVLPAAVAASACLSGAAQTASTGQTSKPSTATVGASTSLNANPNALANIYGSPVEEVVARVNDRVITNSDLARAQSQLAAESRQNNWTLDEYNQHENNLLRDLIDQQLLLSKGKQLGITGDTELIKRLDDIRKQNHLGSMDDLEKAVEQQGTSYEDFKANIRNSIITQEVVQNEVGSKIQISQHEVRNYYDAHQSDFTQPESIHLREILIPTSANATSAELATADAKVTGVWKQLNAGGNFSELAKKDSSGPTAEQGGDLGDFKRGSLAKVLEDDTFSLPVDAYTKPIRTRQGYIILQVTAHNPGGMQPVEKVEPQIQQAIYMQQIEPAVRKYLTLLREQAYIDIRPGYTDSGASPNETKPTFEASAPPPHKKQKKHKARYVSATGSRTRMAQRNVAAANEKTERHGRHGQKEEAKKNKPVKFRFGHPPTASVAEAQVPMPPAASTPPTPAQQAIAAEASAAPGNAVQPLGPDLEHVPLVTPPKQHKTRFSDEARIRHERKKSEKREKHKVHKAKNNGAQATPLSQTELENQQVQSAPLGLDGDTVHKKKEKKAHAANGHKTRLSDEKRDEHHKKEATPPADNAPSSSSSSGSSSEAAANPS